MAAEHESDPPPVRPVLTARVVSLAIFTLGLYYAVVVYGISKDLQRERMKPVRGWQALFWIGLLSVYVALALTITSGVLVGASVLLLMVTWPFLFFLNQRALAEVRAKHGLPPLLHPRRPLALVLVPLVVTGIIGHISWARQLSETALLIDASAGEWAH